MKVLVAGASGFIGTRLSRQLAESGNEVIALYQNGNPAIDLQHPRITPFQADITSTSEMRTAIRQCETCFHLAALARPWARNPRQFQHVNVDATRTLFQQALEAKVKRIVFTSTASVYGPATAANPVNESCPPATHLDSEYERSKLACEEIVREFQANGLNIVTVYPTRVYGPGPMTSSNALTNIFERFQSGKWRIIPGDGTAVGNYVYIDDVVEGMIQAMFHGPPNEKYLLGGDNLTFIQIVEQLQIQTGRRHRMIHVPGHVLLGYANLQVLRSRLFGLPPSITPAFIKKYLKDWHVDDSKARSTLAVKKTPFAEGLAKTLAWIDLRNQ